MNMDENLLIGFAESLFSRFRKPGEDEEAASAVAEADTVTVVRPQTRAKNVGMSVLVTVTLTCGLVGNAAGFDAAFG